MNTNTTTEQQTTSTANSTCEFTPFNFNQSMDVINYQMKISVNSMLQFMKTKYNIPENEIQEINEHFFSGGYSFAVPSTGASKGKGKTNTKGVETLEKKPRKQMNRKTPDDSTRCIAMTKGDCRCKASRSSKSKNPFLCSLHTRNGTKTFGVVEEYKEEFDNLEDKIKVDEMNTSKVVVSNDALIKDKIDKGLLDFTIA